MLLAALVADRLSCGSLVWSKWHPVWAYVVLVKGGLWCHASLHGVAVVVAHRLIRLWRRRFVCEDGRWAPRQG